jgi:hypothetical protein
LRLTAAFTAGLQIAYIPMARGFVYLIAVVGFAGSEAGGLAAHAAPDARSVVVAKAANRAL